MNKNPTKFPELNRILNIFSERLQTVLGENLLGLYLQGSFVLGSGDLHSDVDFLAIIENDFDAEMVQKIEAMHQAIYDIYPQWSSHLEGSYFPRKLLTETFPNYTPIWYLDNGAKQLERSTHDNDALVRWVTRERGITLFGDAPATYIPEIPANALHQDIRHTMTEWGQEIVDKTYDINNLWAQPFAVIMYCRMLHTLATDVIDSKPAAVQWGLDNLDSQWHDLIQTAWVMRPNPGQKVYQQPPQDDIEQTIAFIQYAIDLSQA